MVVGLLGMVDQVAEQITVACVDGMLCCLFSQEGGQTVLQDYLSGILLNLPNFFLLYFFLPGWRV